MLGLYRKYFSYLLFLLLFCLLPYEAFAVNKGSRYASHSVLFQGDWYKIKVENGTGVYKLTYDDLKKIGLNNPANVKIYGYGGWILDEDFSKPYIDDLPEVSIWMSNEPSSFGKGDYILFYARGDIKWEYNSTNGEFEQTQNPYSFDSYYFITESTEYPFLMESQSSLAASTAVVNTFDDYALYESEKVNVGKTGREFYGESFPLNSSKDFTLSTEGATSDPAIIRYHFIARSTLSSCVLKISLNGTFLKDDYSNEPTSDYYIYAKPINNTIVTNDLKNENKINLRLEGDRGVTNTHLNYIRINYKRRLKPYGAVTLFRSTNLADNLSFNISDANKSLLVFDVTDNTKVSQIETTLSGSTMSFTASNSSVKEYALVDLSKDIPKPTLVGKGKIANQDLHALPNVDMIIISPESFRQYAQELADLHEEDSGLKSLVVNPEVIYNEFSSGKPDVTAYRRFMKMFYDRATNEEDKPKYLLLFGGGTFDNRFLTKNWSEAEKEAMLLTFQSEESLEELASFVTDDYMGFLEDMPGKDFKKATLNIAVGRLPVITQQEASSVVAKIKDYMLNLNKGLWQNNITYVADDFVAGSNGYTAESQHINDSEEFSKYLEKNHPDFIVNKIYEDAYERVVEANGARYPTATKALLDRINNGTLVLNFVGHGTTRSWTHENLLTYSDIDGMNNDKLPLWITATCDFSRFDAQERSGGELALLKRKGGAIALFSTVRVVYTSRNKVMNNNINKHLLVRESGKAARLGDILRKAKSEPDLSDDLNKLKFMLLGDPALRLAYPDDTYRVEVTEINGLDASDDNINIRALDNTVIAGNIVNTVTGEIVTDFNGTLESVVFDSQETIKTKGNGVGADRGKEFDTYFNTLFAGRVDIKNGEFRIEFTAPKDILYQNKHGKMNFYAYDQSGMNKAQGSFYNYTVGGTNPGVPEEENPPVIEEMRLNNILVDPNSTDVIYVNPTPKFYARVSDDTGINLSLEIGHNIALIVDGGTIIYNLTPYFENEDGSTKQGSVTYFMPELSLGNHYMQFRVWDVFNNSTMSDPVHFVVTNDVQSSGYSFEIWGNPAKDYTRFVFTTDIAATNVDLKLSVYSLSGRKVWAYQGRGVADTLNRYIYDWNVNGNGGGRLIPGVYVCIAQVVIDGKRLSIKSQKLIVTDNY